MTRVDPRHLKRLEVAFSCIADVLGRGGQIDMQRGIPVVNLRNAAVGSNDAAVLKARAAGLGEPIAELLSGPRKEWARDLREVALAVRLSGAEVIALAGIEVIERRVIGRCLHLETVSDEGRARIRALFEKATGVIMTDPAPEERAAVGLLLGEFNLGRGRYEMTEIGGRSTIDYRHYLAGSSWVDMNLNLDSNLPGQALLTALQVRSLRREALRTSKQAFYTVQAVKHLHRQGRTIPEIQQKLGVPADTLGRWLEREAANTAAAPAPDAPKIRPPSEKQGRFVLDILSDLPFLEPCIDPAWRTNADVAKSFLDRVSAHQAEWRAQARVIRRHLAMRRALADGETLSAASRSAGIPVTEAAAALEIPPAGLVRTLSQSVGAALGVQPRIDLAAL